MQSDLPHTLYAHKEKKTSDDYKVKKNDKAFELQDQALQEAIARRKAKAEAKARGEIPYTMEEIFKK